MKIISVVSMVALMALSAPIVVAQPANHMAGGMGSQTMPAEQMDQRFQHMDSMMGAAKTAHGAQRMQFMQQHMALMLDQMKAMHAMMGGGMMGGGMMGGGMMGGSAMGAGNAGGNDAEMLNRMRARMDLMQRMMEQMLDQQNMMLQTDRPHK